MIRIYINAPGGTGLAEVDTGHFPARIGLTLRNGGRNELTADQAAELRDALALALQSLGRVI